VGPSALRMKGGKNISSSKGDSSGGGVLQRRNHRREIWACQGTSEEFTVNGLVWRENVWGIYPAKWNIGANNFGIDGRFGVCRRVETLRLLVKTRDGGSARTVGQWRRRQYHTRTGEGTNSKFCVITPIEKKKRRCRSRGPSRKGALVMRDFMNLERTRKNKLRWLGGRKGLA